MSVTTRFCIRTVALGAAASAVLSLLAVPVVARAEQPVVPGETVLGELVQAWPEYEHLAEATGLDHEGPLSWIETDRGDTVRVPTEDVEGIPVGATVEVTLGEEVADAPAEEEGLEPAREVLEAEVVEAPAEAPAAAPAAAPVSNAVTVVRVVPRGGVQDATTIAQVVDAVNGPVTDFWRGQTDGAVEIGATGWADWVFTTADCSDPYGLWREAAAAAGFQPGPGKHLMLYIPRNQVNLSACAYGLAEVGAAPTSGGRLYVRALLTSLIAHELGHNFGLGHSSEIQCHEAVDSGTCRTSPYNDWYDVMGVSWDVLGSLNAPHAHELGVLPSAERVSVRTWDPAADFTLVPMAAATGLRTVDIVDPYGDHYWLEYRQASGQDAWLGTGENRAGLEQGVTLRRARTSPEASDSSLLLDGTPSSSSGWSTDRRVALPVGQTVRLYGADFSLTVLSVTDTAAVVRLSPDATPTGARYSEAGGPSGVLGAPTSRQLCGLRASGCFRSFAGGSIYWTHGAGARLVTGQVRPRWVSLGAENGRLGYPLDDTTCGLVDGGCGQRFEGGGLYGSASTPVHYVVGAIGQAWDATGRGAGALGYPLMDESCGLRGAGCFQHYQRGSIYWSSSTGARVVSGTIRERWAALGWEAGRLGYPLTDTDCGLPDGGCAQAFQGGWLYGSSGTPVQLVRDPVRPAWLAEGGEGGRLGYPTSDEWCGLRDGGCFQHFSGGSVYRSPVTGTRIVTGSVRDRWSAFGWEAGQLGYPVTDTFCGLVDGGCFQHFQGGSLYGSANTSVHRVLGAIRAKWGATGWESGRLGYPTSDEICGLRDGGCFSDFQHGSVYWSPTTGARLLTGPTHDRWLELGGPGGPLGYPLIDPYCGLLDGGCFQQFQGGYLYSSASTPVHVVLGAIGARWGSTGWEAGPLGYPTSDEVCLAGGCYQEYQAGSIGWSPESGAHTVVAPLRDAWVADGQGGGSLGWPVEEARTTGGDRIQRFQGGTLTFVASTGVVLRS